MGLWLLEKYGFNTEQNTTQILYFPYSFFNTSYYYLLNKVKDEKFGINAAVMVKNNTDLFILEKEKWMQVSPGIGLRIFIGGVFGVSAEAGIENRNILFFTQNKYVNKSNWFFTIGFQCPLL